jgi:hypothetical protein
MPAQQNRAFGTELTNVHGLRQATSRDGYGDVKMADQTQFYRSNPARPIYPAN